MLKPPQLVVLGGGASDDASAELKRLRDEIDARDRQETAVAELGQAALTGVDPMILLGQACALVELTMDVTHCRALELAPGGGMILRAAIGTDESFTRCADDRGDDDSIGMFVYLQDRPVTFSTAPSNDETRFTCSHLREHHRISSAAGVTIRTQHGAFGVLLVYARGQRQFHDYEIAFLNSTANIIGEAMARGRTEEALRQSQSRLRQLIASSLDAVVTFDRDGKVVEWNPQAEITFDLPAREVIGKPFPQDLLPQRDNRLLDRLTARAQSGASPMMLRRRLETVAMRRSGSTFPAEITIETAGTERDVMFTAFIRDISERKQAQLELEQRELRFRTIFEKSWSGVALVDASGSFSFIGSSTINILGYDETELIGHSILDYVHPRERDAARRIFGGLIEEASREAHGELRFRHKNGHWLWTEGFAQNLLHEPSVNAIVLNYRDVTQRRATEKQLEYRAHYDALTNLPNRVLFRDRVVNSVAHSRRNHSGLGIAYLDLDHFKLVNDGLGHTIGDALLGSVARRLEGCLRASDTISRIGGDEFSILINDVNDSGRVTAVTRKLLDAFAEPFRVEEQDLYVTASIGISLFPEDGDDVETLVKCADAAMYRAKELGRNQAQMFTPSMNERYVRRLAVEQSLHQALEQGQLELHYQPIFDRSGLNVIAVEALSRWNHPARGLVQPSEFIGLAEETGLIIPLGNWVLRRACAQLREWWDDGLKGIRCSINVSANHLQQTDFTRTVRSTLEEFAISPGALEIEITETTAMQNIERTMRVLRELQEMGVTVAIDDFGTGQSSLIYLTQFPIDTIKIDKAFLRDVASNETAAAIVSYVINLAHTLKLNVVAEGVESEAQLAFLKHYACDEIQGFLLGKPLPAEELHAFASTRRPL